MTDEIGLSRVRLIDCFDLARRAVEVELRYLLPATVTKYLPPGPGPYGPLPAMVEVLVDLEVARSGRAGDADASVPERFKPIAGALAGEGELVGRYVPFTCPIEFCGPDGGWLRGALLPGQPGCVSFTDRALGRWLVALAVPVDPGEGATHGENLCDAFFRPGARNGARTPAGSVPAEGVTLGTADPADPLQHLLHLGAPETSLTTTAPTLTLDGAVEVKVGAAAADLIAKAVPLVQILTQLQADLTEWVPVPNDGGAALKTILALPGGTLSKLASLLAQVSAVKGKVE